jgi:hypothetical protein
VAVWPDNLLRRTTIAITGQATPALLEEEAAIAGAVLGWQPERVRAEVALAKAELQFGTASIHGRGGTGGCRRPREDGDPRQRMSTPP